MDLSKQPIIAIGDYQLTYRPTEEYLEIEKALRDTHIGFYFLQRINRIGASYAFIHILVYIFKVVGASFAVVCGVFLGLMYVLVLGVDSFFASFKIINPKNPLPSINRVPESDVLANWLSMGFLAVFCGVHIYLWRIQKIPFDSSQMLMFSVLILMLATPYYLKRFIKLLL
ncbi:MAG: hypothetical protein Q4B88_02055 [Moraxella sp.]|nr:hypothetical protein [Moraxella sp.]